MRPHIVARQQSELDHFMMNRLLRRIGAVREQFTWGTTYEPIPATASSVIALGIEAANHYFPAANNILRWRGRVLRMASGAPFIATFKPSQLLHHRASGHEAPLRNPPRYQGVAMLDLRLGISLGDPTFVSPFASYPKPDYLKDPSPEGFEQWVREFEQATTGYVPDLSPALSPQTYLSFDIETPYKKKKADEADFEESESESEKNLTILRISFSYKEGQAVTIPWDPRYFSGIQRLLLSRVTKVVWNGLTFDIPVLDSVDFKVNGYIFDGMDAFHVLYPDLDKGLEWVTSFFTDLLPWKHLSDADPQLYSCIDSDAALRNINGIVRQLHGRGQWGTFLRHAVTLMPILKEAGDRGNHCDEEFRRQLLDELTQEQARLHKEAQPLVPEQLKPRKLYKKFPGEDPERTFVDVSIPGEVKQCSVCGATGVTKGEHLKGGKKNPCHGATFEKIRTQVRGWHEILDFNPNSSDQMLEYIKHFKHPVGEKLRDDFTTTESAESKHLKKLAKRYPQHRIYQNSLDLKLVTKARGTVIGLAPDEDMKIHSTYVNSPNTWRLGCRNVNMQNQGKRNNNKWAKRARKVIVASPGNVLVQADSSSIEAVMVGWFLNDPNYIQLAKKSIHAYLVCKKLGIAFTQANVEMVKSKEKTLYDQLKITNHATNYGMTPYTLWQTFPELFKSKGEAQAMQGFIFSEIPQLPQWHHEVRLKAQKDTYLENPWKHRLQMFDVFTRRPDGEVKLGKDGNRAIAYNPQSSAGCFMRDNLLIMGSYKREWFMPEADDALYGGFWRQFMPANVSVHDGYTLDVPKSLADDAVDYLGRLLTRPCMEMGGLTIGCEIEIGHNWLEMEKVKTITTLEDEAGWLAEAA